MELFSFIFGPSDAQATSAYSALTAIISLSVAYLLKNFILSLTKPSHYCTSSGSILRFQRFSCLFVFFFFCFFFCFFFVFLFFLSVID